VFHVSDSLRGCDRPERKIYLGNGPLREVSSLERSVVTTDKIETPREFFEHIVELDVEDFIETPTDLRLAYHSCTSLLSFRDLDL
jgi:hypothetical protein